MKAVLTRGFTPFASRLPHFTIVHTCEKVKFHSFHGFHGVKSVRIHGFHGVKTVKQPDFTPYFALSGEAAAMRAAPPIGPRRRENETTEWSAVAPQT